MEVFVGVSILVFVAYMVIMFRYGLGLQLLKKKRSSNSDGEMCSISVVIALKNEMEQLEVLIKSLLAINYAGPWEVILVDDGSTDCSYAFLLENCPPHFRVLKNEGDGKKQALETGVRKSSSDWIVMTDADCFIGKEWLTGLTQVLTAEIKMVLGPVFIHPNASDFLGLQKIEFLGLQGATAGAASIGSPIAANGANMMFKREVFMELNPYENNYELKTGDDQYLMMAIHEKYPESITYALNQNALVTTLPVTGLNKYLSQRIRWASKGSTYTNFEIIFTGMIVFLASLMAVENLVYGWLIGNYWMAFGFIVIKMILDLPLIAIMAKFSDTRMHPIHYLSAGFLYPFVVVISVIAGFFKRDLK